MPTTELDYFVLYGMSQARDEYGDFDFSMDTDFDYSEYSYDPNRSFRDTPYTQQVPTSILGEVRDQKSWGQDNLPNTSSYEPNGGLTPWFEVSPAVDYPDVFTPNGTAAGSSLPVYTPPGTPPPPAPMSFNGPGTLQQAQAGATLVKPSGNDNGQSAEGEDDQSRNLENPTNNSIPGEEPDVPLEPTVDMGATNLPVSTYESSVDFREFDPAIHGSIQEYAQAAEEREKQAIYALLVGIDAQIELTPNEEHTSCLELPNSQSCINHSHESDSSGLSDFSYLNDDHINPYNPNPRRQNDISIPIDASDFEIVKHLLENNPSAKNAVINEYLKTQWPNGVPPIPVAIEDGGGEAERLEAWGELLAQPDTLVSVFDELFGHTGSNGFIDWANNNHALSRVGSTVQIVFGLVEIVGGVTIASGSGVTAVGTGGTAAPVAVPVFVAGGAVAFHGGDNLATGIDNFWDPENARRTRYWSIAREVTGDERLADAAELYAGTLAGSLVTTGRQFSNASKGLKVDVDGALAPNRGLLANRSASLQTRAGELTRSQIIDSISGLTRQGDDIAAALRRGDLELSALGDDLFEKAWRLKGGQGSAPQAFAYGEQLFVRRNASNILSEVVHEGTHGLDYLRGFNGTVHQLEKRAYFFERQFQNAGGGHVEFSRLDEMLEFILREY